MAKPSFPFYPDDWMNDLGLRLCSPLTRAIWIDMMCLMHQGVPYGHLSDASGQLPVKVVANRCHVTVKQLATAIAELESHNVFSRTEEGGIFSRRMVRDEQRRIVRAAGGPKSLDNPSVPRPKGIHKGILPKQHSDPSFHPEEEEVVVIQKPKNKDPAKKPYDPMPGWERFVREYPPHRINEWTDRGIWFGVVEDEETEGMIFSKLGRFKRSAEWIDNRGKFVPAAARFIGQRMFLKEPGPEPGGDGAVPINNKPPEGLILR